ncbi:CTTNBP2 N-terminal-like protein [Triplophysa rosa]|uniref:CTTNBP2 N-terminal-like protein-like n=1 Tax=Triplophysa rosa TaxID=992332 RepID=A0A9W8C503_TRIRA|nr:CTTNBP2 N-terminal-like protein [Triplophysa rosa]KAI7807298.1 putative CTTNBP2 N-terminal-like protein-like [Triplophysa rosa]
MAPTTESRLNVEDLSKKELLLLFSVLEGELEARDFVIQTLRAQHRDSYMWERYGKYSLSDPFLALQRDSEVLQNSGQGRGNGGSSSQRRQGICGAAAVRADPLAVLKLVVGHCRRMQEKMLKQLAAAESRHRRIIADLEEEKRKHAEDAAEGDDVTYILEKERERLLQQLEFEKAKTSRIEREKKRLHDQLEDQRVQQKHLMTALSRECKRSGSRAHEESQRATELCHRLERERSASQALRAELEEEKKRAMQMEARREELLAEFDTEREQLSLRLRKEEARCRELQEEMERLRRQMSAGKMNGHHVPTEDDGRVDVLENQSQNTLTNGSSPSNPQAHSPSASNTECSLQSTILTQSPDMSSLQAVYQAGIHQRFHAARHKFQGTLDEDIPASPPPCDANAISPSDGVSSKHAARNTVTQALNRFGAHQGSSKPAAPNTSPFGTDYRTLSQSGVMSPTIRSPTIPRAERGTPPPIPPKKPGLAETPPSPASHRAARLAQMTAGCGRSSSLENSKEPDFVLSSSG